MFSTVIGEISLSWGLTERLPLVSFSQLELRMRKVSCLSKTKDIMLYLVNCISYTLYIYYTYHHPA